MTLKTLIKNHTAYSDDLDCRVLYDICIFNAEAGIEAQKLAKAFGIKEHNSMLVRNGPNKEYVSIIASRDYGSAAVIFREESYAKDRDDMNMFYYPDVADALEDFYDLYPELLISLYTVEDEPTIDIYDALGMNPKED